MPCVPTASSIPARGARRASDSAGMWSRTSGRRPAGVQLGVNRRKHVPEVPAQAHERLARLPEPVANGHLGVTVALGEKVEREHLRVVEVVHDLCAGGGLSRERAVTTLAVADGT